jgi:nucleoside-diphosphate-sugar epimerase
MRVLLTGGRGFVGSYVSERLRRLPWIELSLLGQGALDRVRLGQKKTLMEALKNELPFDVVIHLAAHIGDDADEIMKSNFHGIHDILDYCNQVEVRRLIHLSRSFKVDRGINAFHSSRHDRIYEYSKRYAELLIKEDSLVPTRILKITAPVWPTMPRSRYLSQILISISQATPIKIFGHGIRRQNYVRLDDIADAIIASSIAPEFSGVEEFAVVGPENFTDYQLAQTVAERLSVPFSYEFVPPPLGVNVDESDYGIDSGVGYPILPLNPRAIDGGILRNHLKLLSPEREK